MKAARPYRAALFGALAMLPAMTAGAGAQATAALPVPETAPARTVAVPGTARLKSGLDALAAGETGASRAVRDSLPAGSLDRHVLAWAIALYGGDKVPSGDIAAAAEMLPGWPGMTMLRQNSERAIYRENPPPQTVVQAFSGSQPQTLQGVVLLARSYVALGNPGAARSVLSPFWRTAKLEAKDEAAIVKEFGQIIPAADHRFRMERMFYADRVNSALSIAELAGAKPLADAWAAALRGKKDAPRLLAAVPAAQRSAGYFFAEAEYLRKQQKFSDAAAVLLKAPTDRAALVDPDAWWVERRVLSRELVDQGDMKTAYRIVADHAAESPSSAADAEFHAGWYALRFLNDPVTARRHFAAIQAASTMPLSQSRAEYWLGRSAEAMGDRNEAIAQYRLAAAYPTTFYGQIAAAKLGVKQLSLSNPGSADGATKKRFQSREMVQALQRFAAAGYADRSRQFYMQLADTLTNPTEVGLLAAMAEKSGQHQVALQIGKKAYVRGLPVDTLAFPVAAIPSGVKTTAIEKSVVYAVARQESAFNPAAVSHAGARGLLQLMPGTAKMVAKAAGVPYSLPRLTSDPGYNATLGAAHLADLVDDFSGSYIMAFAAYNAGKSRVTKWVQQYGDPRDPNVDAIDWIERIPFTETRNYVQRCTENLQVYRARLGEPALVINRDLHRGNPT